MMRIKTFGRQTNVTLNSLDGWRLNVQTEIVAVKPCQWFIARPVFGRCILTLVLLMESRKSTNTHTSLPIE